LDWQTVQDIQFMGWDQQLWTFVVRGNEFWMIKYGTRHWIGGRRIIHYLDWNGEQWTAEINQANNTFSIIKNGTLTWLTNQSELYLLSWSGPGNNAWVNRKCTIQLQ
jgi:hypothetical protein